MASKGRIAVSGASGFVGSKLVLALKEAGYEVWPLVRHPTSDPHEIFYDYDERLMDLDKLAQCTAVIHLAGKNVFGGLWTESFKRELYDSRVKSTRFIAHKMAKVNGPKVLLNASAAGIYGDRADQKLDEESHPGTGFLAKLCIDWERGALFAKEAGLRVVKMRFGIVLDKHGGMLKKLLPWFKLGLGSILGNGEQYLSYVTRDELVAMIIFVLEHDDINGPVNMVAFEPTTNAEFSQALAQVLDRKVHVRVPSLLLKLVGEQGAMVLSSARAYPKKLMDHGFNFVKHESMEGTLRRVLR